MRSSTDELHKHDPRLPVDPPGYVVDGPGGVLRYTCGVFVQRTSSRFAMPRVW